MNQNMPIELYSDGSCINNPGPGGIGYIIRYHEVENGEQKIKQLERSKGFRLTTNNRMEILAGIEGLTDIQSAVGNGTIKGAQHVIVLTDSKYFCDAINQRWIDKWQSNNWVTSTQTPVKNKDLWERIINITSALRSTGIQITINHIPGHKGYEFNEAADLLANTAAKGTELLIDDVYEATTKR